MIRKSNDPVVEIRAVRRELSERFGGDVDALCDFLVEGEKLHPERLVNRPSRPPVFPSTRRSGAA